MRQPKAKSKLEKCKYKRCMYKRLYPLTKPRYCAKHVERMGIISLETPEGDLIKEASHRFKESIAYQERIGITKNVDKAAEWRLPTWDDLKRPLGDAIVGGKFVYTSRQLDKPTLMQRIKAFIWKSQ